MLKSIVGSSWNSGKFGNRASPRAQQLPRNPGEANSEVFGNSGDGLAIEGPLKPLTRGETAAGLRATAIATLAAPWSTECRSFISGFSVSQRHQRPNESPTSRNFPNNSIVPSDGLEIEGLANDRSGAALSLRSTSNDTRGSLDRHVRPLLAPQHQLLPAGAERHATAWPNELAVHPGR